MLNRLIVVRVYLVRLERICSNFDIFGYNGLRVSVNIDLLFREQVLIANRITISLAL